MGGEFQNSKISAHSAESTFDDLEIWIVNRKKTHGFILKVPNMGGILKVIPKNNPNNFSD